MSVKVNLFCVGSRIHLLCCRSVLQMAMLLIATTYLCSGDILQIVHKSFIVVS
jgi:hypothetical protein